MQFANNLINLRKREDLTIEELTLLLDVNRDDVINWEKGEELPNLTIIQNIARLFSVTVDELVNMLIPIKTVDVDKLKIRTRVFSMLLGLSVFVIFFSIGLFLFLSRNNNEKLNEISTLVLITGVLIGVFGIVIPTLNFESFCKKNYIVFEPDKNEVKKAKMSFIIKFIISLIFIGVGIIQFIIIFINYNSYMLSLAIMLSLLGFGLGIIIESGIMMSMYTAPDDVFKV